jgi:branched-chain amino acid transport system substrate-binding protein
MRNITRRDAINAALLGASLISLVALSGCGSRVPDTVKIGVAQPMSGDLAVLGKDMVNGVQLAVNQLNSENYKVGGKAIKFEMVALDDKANAEEGKKVAEQLVAQGVVAVVGHLNSGVSIAAAPIYAAKGIAQLAISTNPKFTALGFPTTLRLVANDDLQARAVGAFAAGQITGTKFAVVDDGTPYGKGLADNAAMQLQGKKTVSLRQSFDDKTKDFSQLAAKLKADDIEVVVSTLNDFQVIALINDLTKIDYSKKITILGTDTLKTTEMIGQASRVGGLYCTSSVLEAREFSGGKAFLTAFQVAYKAPPAYGAQYTYDATLAVAAVIKRIESAEPAKITEALRKSDNYAPVTGTFKWNAVGEPLFGAVTVYAVQNGRWESLVSSSNW